MTVKTYSVKNYFGQTFTFRGSKWASAHVTNWAGEAQEIAVYYTADPWPPFEACAYVVQLAHGEFFIVPTIDEVVNLLGFSPETIRQLYPTKAPRSVLTREAARIARKQTPAREYKFIQDWLSDVDAAA